MISVIIPTRNRASMLAAALDSLVTQTIDPRRFEILVIDNGSTDDTPDVAKQASEKLANMRYCYESEPGLHAGRHLGLKESRGDLLAFADDDIVALPTWLAAIEDAFSKPHVALVGGNNLPMFIDPPPPWLTELWGRGSAHGGRAIPALSLIELEGEMRPISPMLVWGCNFSIRKNVLLQAGGFHPDGMPKELIRFRGDGETHVSNFVAQSGMRCLFQPEATVYHKVTPERMTHAYFHQRGFNQGVSQSYTELRSRATTQATQSRRRYRLLRNVVRRLRRKVALQRCSTHLKRALSELEAGHRKGFAFHQEVYRSDPEVREWVHRASYF